ncbi:MAG TPA: patatin-like phospholipase family protein [Jatrophihabitans sp.]|nr:patatin-like phospholipase family protein [Jatrophihabitans sp.]
MTNDGVVGVVLSGGGAHGAYEAGALSVLLPQMAEEGRAPTRLLGTSAGALSAVALAGWAQDGWAHAAQQLAAMWSAVRFDQVAHVPSSIGKDVAAYLGHYLTSKAELVSLLDTTPMRATLSQLLPLDKMHENIRDGAVDAVAVAATSASTAGTVVFVEARRGVALPPYDAVRNITYVATQLTVDHVLASAAVPVAFTPIQLPGADDWYVDGGVRLNTPLKPALKLGCDHLAVVATHPSSWLPYAGPGPRPDVFGAASVVLQAVLVDHMIEDLRTLVKVNSLVAAGRSGGRREVDVRFTGPPADQAHAIADLARAIDVDLLTDSDAWLLENLVGGTGGGRAELLSFLLFQPEFLSALVSLGAAHATTAAGWSLTL